MEQDLFHKTLDKELNQAMYRWLVHNGVHQDRGRLHLSEIFLWYKEDFPTPIQNYLQRWLPQIELPKELVYFPYDWSLNERCTASPSP